MHNYNLEMNKLAVRSQGFKYKQSVHDERMLGTLLNTIARYPGLIKKNINWRNMHQRTDKAVWSQQQKAKASNFVPGGEVLASNMPKVTKAIGKDRYKRRTLYRNRLKSHFG